MNEFKIGYFAALLEKEQIERLHDDRLNCEANLNNAKVSIKPGKKYTKIDIGTSGRFMVENETGNIFGIKGYGVIHRGHFYGTLDTINEYSWGGYYPEKRANPTPLRDRIPILTFAPETPPQMIEPDGTSRPRV